MVIKRPKLVIFDCDGVLVDSEQISHLDLLQNLVRRGAKTTLEECYQLFLGTSIKSARETIKMKFGLDLSEAEIHDPETTAGRGSMLDVKAIPGILEALRNLSLPRCVASSSSPTYLQNVLTTTGQIDHFTPNIFSASMVKRGKPFPDLFEHAAKTMGFAPSECLVIEDSPAGIEAAQRANMRVFAFVGGAHAVPGSLREKAEAFAPDLIFDDMRRLPEFLGE